MTYPRLGNLHDPNVLVRVHWACGHTTEIWVSKSFTPTEGVQTSALCYDCTARKVRKDLGLDS
jgi:hypothetical protein